MEKNAFIYIVHGRKERQSQKNMRCIQNIQQQYPQCEHAVAYLEGESDSIEAILQQKQATNVYLVPLLLYPASHYLEDLPQRLQNLQLKANVQLLPVLAQAPSFAPLLAEKIKQEAPLSKTCLLLTHGASRYPEVAKAQEELCDFLSQACQRPVKLASLHGAQPYQEVFAVIAEADVFPLFLTEGRLVQTCKKAANAYPGLHFLSTLEGSTLLEQLLTEIMEVAYVSNHD